jgi:metallo-beta-lactamase family protein
LHPESDPKLELEILTIRSRWEGLSLYRFAVERAQMIMYLLWQLREEGKIPDVPTLWIRLWGEFLMF